MNKIFYIYAWKRLDNNQYFYIGKGHGKRAFVKSNRNTFFKRIVSKYPCEVQILIENLSEDQAFRIEKYLIMRFRQKGQAYCNLTDGGEGTFGLKRPDLSITNSKRIGALHPSFGKPGPNLGIKMNDIIKDKIKLATIGIRKTDEHRLNISRGKTGRKCPESFKDKLRNIKTGFSWGKHTNEFKIIMSERMRGLAPSKNCILKCIERNSKQVIDLSNGYVWDSAKDASEVYRINYNTIRNMLNGNCRNNTKLRYLSEI